MELSAIESYRSNKHNCEISTDNSLYWPETNQSNIYIKLYSYSTINIDNKSISYPYWFCNSTSCQQFKINYSNNYKIINILLNKNPIVNIADHIGLTPLHFASGLYFEKYDN